MNDVIPAPEPAHYCPQILPQRSGGYGSTGYADGALIRCPKCGLWWYSGPCVESMGPITEWRRVRWYHREFKTRIANWEGASK